MIVFILPEGVFFVVILSVYLSARANMVTGALAFTIVIYDNGLKDLHLG